MNEILSTEWDRTRAEYSVFQSERDIIRLQVEEILDRREKQSLQDALEILRRWGVDSF